MASSETEKDDIAVTVDVEQAQEFDTADIVLDTVHASHEYTDAQYKNLLRKIDLRLLPLLWVIYGVQQADKTSTSTQATFGLRTDTHLVGQQFSTLSTIFYVSYLAFEPFAGYLIQKFPVGKTLALFMFIWGVIVLCIAFAKNWAGLMVLRSLQGVFESTISPSVLIMTGAWYKTTEHSSRSIIWGTANSGMGVITQLIMYGIGTEAAKHPGGLAPWKGISFFLGALTIVLSGFVYFIVGTPREVRWLSEEEKRMAAARTVSNQTGTDRQKRAEWKWDQVIIAAKDPQTYFFFFVTLVNSLPNGGTTSFGNLVYTSFGFTSLETLLEGTIPQNAVSVLWFLFVAYITTKWRKTRFCCMMLSVVPAFIGMLCLALLPKTAAYQWPKYGLYLMTVTGNLPGLLIWTMLPSNVAGRTKKAISATVLFVAYCCGNAVGAQIFQAKDAPNYIPALAVCASMYGVEFALMGAWCSYYIFTNRRRAKLVAAMGLTAEQEEDQGRINAESDMPDSLNVFFRYDF